MYKKKLKEPATVRDIIRECAKITDVENLPVTYRTFGPNGEDLFAGRCVHRKNFLIPEDFDSYSMGDKISQYEVYAENDGKPELIVWYESGWISG